MELHDIKVQAWSPLMQGQLLDNEVLKKIADKHGKSVAQIILRWDIQQDILVNVKSIKSERMIANRQIFDFSLDSEDMKAINSLNERTSCRSRSRTF